VSIFTLDAQVLGAERQVTVEHAPTGFVVSLSSGRASVRTLAEAVRAAARDIGSHLERARRKGVPWGLHVSVGDVAAVYGEWPLLSGPSPDRRRRPSVVARIRCLWRDADGPLAALDNAVKIIEAYTARSRRQ
jgi:hypothetical protein